MNIFARQRGIDVFDFLGNTWELLLPPTCFKQKPGGNEVWMAVRKTDATGAIKDNFDMIPVPVFTDWWPAPMSNERYTELNRHPQTSVLTQAEFKQGWHYCWDWDGLLVNAYDMHGEGAACTCYPRASED